MTKEEFEILVYISENKKLITIDDLKDKSDRVLMHGYTFERDSIIVKIENGEIIKYFKGNIVPVKENKDYIPNKRSYPERCDYEFCKLLKERGCYISFTTWSDK